jgi:hypothetical protein
MTMIVVIHFPLAHIGHWYWLILFALPALLVLAGAIRTTMHERGKARQERRPGNDR